MSGNIWSFIAGASLLLLSALIIGIGYLASKIKIKTNSQKNQDNESNSFK